MLPLTLTNQTSARGTYQLWCAYVITLCSRKVVACGCSYCRPFQFLLPKTDVALNQSELVLCERRFGVSYSCQELSQYLQLMFHTYDHKQTCKVKTPEVDSSPVCEPTLDEEPSMTHMKHLELEVSVSSSSVHVDDDGPKTPTSAFAINMDTTQDSAFAADQPQTTDDQFSQSTEKVLQPKHAIERTIFVYNNNKDSTEPVEGTTTTMNRAQTLRHHKIASRFRVIRYY